MADVKEKTEGKKVTVVIGAYGDAKRPTEIVDQLKKAKFDGAKTIKEGRLIYAAAGECEEAESADFIKRLEAAGFKGYVRN